MNDQQTGAVVEAGNNAPSLIAKLGARFGVEATKLLSTLKATAFRTPADKPAVTNEQMAALLIVSDQYGLNPFTKEIFAFPDKGGIIPVVSVDGWIRIINDHPEMGGIEFNYGPPKGSHFEWIDCVITRKDRTKPIIIREFWDEVARTTQPWQTHGNRMHRHKALIQCARIAFGFSGIYDEDEAERIRAAHAVDVTPDKGEPEKKPESKTASVVDRLKRASPPPLDVEPEAPPEEQPQEASPGPKKDLEPGVVTDFKQSLYIIENTKDPGIAAEALDIARSCLTPEEVGRLTTVFKARDFEGEA